MVFHPADHGGKWIRPEKRWQIYERDRFRCVYCQTQKRSRLDHFTLDHVKVTSKGGDNEHVNLLTCCKRCNSKRADMSIERFMVYLIIEKRQDPNVVKKRILRAKHAPLPQKRQWTMQALAEWWGEEDARIGNH